MNLQLLSISKKITVTCLLLIPITFLDFISGELSFSFFYLLPIAFATWYINRNTGLFFSVLSAVLWYTSDQFNNPIYSHHLIPLWNALVRLAFFISITLLLSLIKSEREREKEIIQFIVHDLRSPLASLLTSFKLLNEDNIEPLTRNQKELIDLNISTGNRMMIFINSLLDLDRLGRRRLPLMLINSDVSLIINSAVKQVKILAEEKNISIKINCLVENIRADANLLLRIIVNLLSNAIKESTKGTQIEIKSEHLDKTNIIFSVKDQGPGIPKGMEKKIFGKYIQGNSSSSGSGIGLAFCKLAVEAHKGYIKLESVEGKGTTIFFVLPQITNGISS